MQFNRLDSDDIDLDVKTLKEFSVFFNFQFIDNFILFKGVVASIIFLLAILILIEIIQYITNDLLAVLTFPAWLRGLVYLAIVLLIIITGVEGGKEFIYYQF